MRSLPRSSNRWAKARTMGLYRMADKAGIKNAVRRWMFPVFDKLESIVNEYVTYIQSKDFHEDNDYKHYIYEAVMLAFYGKDFFTWYNKKVS